MIYQRVALEWVDRVWSHWTKMLTLPHRDSNLSVPLPKARPIKHPSNLQPVKLMMSIKSIIGSCNLALHYGLTWVIAVQRKTKDTKEQPNSTSDQNSGAVSWGGPKKCTEKMLETSSTHLGGVLTMMTHLKNHTNMFPHSSTPILTCSVHLTPLWE